MTAEEAEEDTKVASTEAVETEAVEVEATEAEAVVVVATDDSQGMGCKTLDFFRPGADGSPKRTG